MNVKAVLSMILEMNGTIKFFPSEPAAHVALARMVCKWAASEAEVRILIDAMLENFDEWPGPKTFRRTFVRLCRPALGPAEHISFPSVAAPKWFLDWSLGRTLALPAPAETSAVSSVQELAVRRTMFTPRRRSAVHVLAPVQREPYVRTPEEQERLDRIAAELERLQAERRQA